MGASKFSLKLMENMKKRNWKGKLAAALAGVMGATVVGPTVVSIMPEEVVAADATAQEIQVKTWAELKSAIEGAAAGSVLNIKVMNTLAATDAITIGNNNRKITVNLTSGGDAAQTIYVNKDKSGNLAKIDNWFRVQIGSTFNVTNINMSGKAVTVTETDNSAKVSDYLAQSKIYYSSSAKMEIGSSSNNKTPLRANDPLDKTSSLKITAINRGVNNGVYVPNGATNSLQKNEYYFLKADNNNYLRAKENGDGVQWGGHYADFNKANGTDANDSKPDLSYWLWKYRDNETLYNVATGQVIYNTGSEYGVGKENKSLTGGGKTYTFSDPASAKVQTNGKTSNIGYFIYSEGNSTVKLDNVTISDLNMDTEMKMAYQSAAPIYIANGKFTMESGNIANNSVGYLTEQYNDWFSGQTANKILDTINGLKRTDSAGAIIFAGGTEHSINDGKIIGNRSDTGAIVVKTPVDNRGNQETEVTFGAAEGKTPLIGGNIGLHYAGAVYINPGENTEKASFVMKGGEIKDNFTWYKGGAIFASCEENGYGVGKKRAGTVAKFEMDGGIIDNNTAVHRGGAIEVMSDQVYLKKGQITNNNSRVLGGAIYVEGDRSDRTYILYLPSAYITENHAWTETKTGKEDDDYGYLKRKLLYNAGAFVENGEYTYNNPLGNVRKASGTDSINRGSANSVYEGPDSTDVKGKKAWTESLSANLVHRWDLADGQTSDYKDYPGYSGHGGGIWTCALGGYASIGFVDGEVDGAVVKNNYSNLNTLNDITAHSRDGGFILSDSDVTKTSTSPFVTTNRNPNFNLQWNKLYTGGDFDIKNTANVSDPTANGTAGILIKGNNARNGGAIATNGKLILGKANDVYEHRSEVEFEKTWANDTGVSASNPVPVAFQAYIGGKAVPGYQFILDGKADPQGNKEMLLNVYESAPYRASISLPYALGNTPTFKFNAAGQTNVSTLDNIWAFGTTSNITGDITEWNFEIREMPVDKKTISVANGNYLLIKKKNDTIPIEFTDRDFNFTDANGNYYSPTPMSNGTDISGVVGSDDPVIVAGSSAYDTDLLFVKKVTVTDGSITFNELLNGEYILVPYNETVSVDNNGQKTYTCTCHQGIEFTINGTETKYNTTPMEKPDKVSLTYSKKTEDIYGYGDIFGSESVFTTHTTTAKAYNSNKGSGQAGTSIGNSKRTEAEVEKYIDGKVDKTLEEISTQFTYDIIARVPDQAEDLVISDTLVDWIGFVNGNDAVVTLKVLNDNDHKGDGNGTVNTGKVGNQSVINNSLTTTLNQKAKKIVLNDTLTVKVDDKDFVNKLTGKYIQVTVKAEIKKDHYEDAVAKADDQDRNVTYSTSDAADKGSYTLRNSFDSANYTYRLYKVSDTESDGLVLKGANTDSTAGYLLTQEEIKALGISASTNVIHSKKLGVESYGRFSNTNGKAVISDLTPGKYLVHVMSGGNITDLATANLSRTATKLDRCEIFEIIDGDEDIRWVSVAGNNQGSLPEAFKNDSPYMGEGKQQSGPQVITGSQEDKKNTADDPLHDGIGNRATYAVTYRGGRQQTLKTNTVTVEPQPETPKIEKYVNKKVDDDLKGFNSVFTYDIMAYIPNGVTDVVIDDSLVDWLEFANTDNTLSRIRVLSDNDHIGTGSGTVATGAVNGSNKVVDIALDNKYSVSKTGNRLKVTINDKDTVSQLWGKWVQVTFDAKIKESAYGNVLSKIREKEAASNGRANVTNDRTYNIKDYDKNHVTGGLHYRLYKRSPETGGTSSTLLFHSANSSVLPESARNLLGVNNNTSISRSKKVDEEINNPNQASGNGYGRYEGSGRFENLQDGEYLLYAWSGDNENNVVLNKCEYFRIDTDKNFNWIEVDGTVTGPDYLSTDDPVLDGSDAMHDGIGNRAGYTLGYKGGLTNELKTNVVTVEPPKEKFEITKIWEGDHVTAPTGAVETAFLNALKLKLGGEAIPASASYDHDLKVTSKGADGKTWTIKTPVLPTFEGKKYTLEENIQALKNSDVAAVRDFFKYYNVTYSNSANDSANLKITDIVGNFDPENFAYCIATPENTNKAPFTQAYLKHTNYEPVKDLLNNNNACSRTNAITSQQDFENLIKQLSTGNYVLLAQEKNNSRTREGRWNYDSVRGRSAAFHYQAEDSYADQISEQLVDKYGNTKLHDNTITIAAGADRKLLSGTDHGDGWVIAKSGDTDHIKDKYGITPVYINDTYWGYDITNYVGPGNFSSKAKTNPVVVDLDTLHSGTYFDLTYSGGFGNSRRRYDIVGSERLNTVKYSVYKKGYEGVEGKTLGSVLGTDYKYSNGLAYEATDAQKAYGLYKKDISRDDLTNAITDDGEFIIVAQNNAERIVPVTLKKRFSDGNLVNGGTVYNTKKLFKVVIRKTDLSSVDLTGAQFELRKNNANGEKVILENKGSYFTTGTVLEPGIYYVKETKAPVGFKAVEEFTFRLNDDGSVSDISNTSNGKVSVDGEKTFVINAKNVTDTTKIDVIKKWDYSSGEIREKPDSITIYLEYDKDIAGQFKEYRSYTINRPDLDSDTWTYTIENLPKYVYNADGVTAERLIQYRIREGDVEGYVNSSVEIEMASTGGTSSGTVDNTTYYAFSTYDTGNGSYIGSQIHYLQTSKGYNNPKIPAFCINYPVQGPNTFESAYYYNPVEYKKILIQSPSELSDYIVNSKYARRSNAIRFGNEPLEDLYKRLIVINQYGYGNDTQKFRERYGLSEDQFKWMTQCAIFEYADWYGDNNNINYRNKTQKVFALDNGMGGARKDVTLRKSDGTSTTLHQAYRDFMSMIHTANLTELAKNKQLYLYIPKSTNQQYRYQNLIGVEDVGETITNTKITLVNKSLADLTIQKVDEEGNPLKNKGDLQAEFKLVEALDAEDAKEKAKTSGIASVPVEGNDSALYKFPGVKTGRYWLVETKAPKYFKLGDPVEIIVSTVESTGNNGTNNNTGNSSTGNTGNTQGKTYKALTYKTGSRNVGLTEASDSDTYSNAVNRKEIWTTNQKGELTITDADGKTRYLVYDIETITAGSAGGGQNYYPLTCALWSGPDEGGRLGITPYTGSTNNSPVWAYSNGKLSLNKYRNVNGGITETIYLSNAEHIRTADTDWDYGTSTLQGTLTGTDASTVVLQTWEGSKWVKASNLQPNKQYRILLEEGTGFVPTTPVDPGSGSGSSSGSNTELKVEFANPELVSPNIVEMSDGFGVVGYHFTYKNELSKAKLPSTGGMGTTLFYIIGVSAAVGGTTAIVVRSRRKKNIGQDAS